MSLSARRAWIEIYYSFGISRSDPVALRKESVDRNVDPDADSLTDDVALRKESVDRNMLYDTSSLMKCQSLSARRAWIEMHKGGYYANCDESRSPQGERG